MKLFTISLEVGVDDSSDIVANKLERIAHALRKQSQYPTFWEDAGYGSGSINQDAITLEAIRATWSLDP